MNKTELARQYVEKYILLALTHGKQYSKRFISSVLYQENPGVYKDEEEARFYVRIVTGARANRGKQNKTHEDLARRFALIPSPVSDTPNGSPYVVPKTIKKTLWIADVHGRFYNRGALELAVNYGAKKGCDSVIILGDFLDFYQHSKFDKNPSVSLIFEEQEWGQEMLKLLQDTFGTVILKEGNHDARREAHIARLSATMPELMDMASYRDYLFFDGCRVEFVEDYRHIRYGHKLNAIHGHEYYGGGGIHVAYNRFHKALDNLITAHSHKAQSIIKPNINGHIYGSWTLGCMCQLSPRYSPKNDWSNGFCVTEKEDNDDFEVDNRVIYKGKSFPV